MLKTPNFSSCHRTRRRGAVLALSAAGLLTLAACGSSDGSAGGDATEAATADAADTDVADTDVADTAGADGEVLRVGAIPDQDVDKLNRTYGLVSDYLSDQLGVPVEYVPVTEYSAAVGQFRTGDLDLVWFGGLTGVQARLETDGAVVIAQRDIDPEFQSVFIGNTDAGLAEVSEVAGLSEFAGTRFTFGSESSTSGRLMPQYFLDEAGVEPDGFDGEPGFSGSHDKTIDLVEAGTFQAGALNKAVWESRVAEGTVDDSKVVKLFDTPTYHDYHWVGHPTIDERFGDGFTDSIREALLGLDAADPDQAEILDLFSAGSFIDSDASNYAEIEQIGRKLGLINE